MPLKLKNLELMSDKSNFLLQQFVDSLQDVIFISEIKRYKKYA